MTASRRFAVCAVALALPLLLGAGLLRERADLGAERACGCGQALATAIITRPDVVPDRLKRELAPIIGKYLPATE